MTDAGWTEFDLPRPPSVNRFMRKLDNKTPCVRAWILTYFGVETRDDRWRCARRHKCPIP
jgi:hypothetical protein